MREGGGDDHQRRHELGSSSGRRCQECGNQAKRECSHMRCRTCCRSKGFECQTHIKSTWVPTYTTRQPPSTTNPKTLTSHHLIIPNPSSSGLAANFPGQVRVPAMFRCVRMSSVDDGTEQYAYQTAVRIGGRVFKGILYDQGPPVPEEEEQIIIRAGGGPHAAAQLANNYVDAPPPLPPQNHHLPSSYDPSPTYF